MTKKRIAAFIIIFVGLVSIVGGGIFALIGKDSNSTQPKEEIKLDNKPNKSFKTVFSLEEEEFQEINQDDFESVTKKIGFRESECESGFCVARKKTYANYENYDTISIGYIDDTINSIGTFTYYHENDYKLDIVASTLNSLINNYIGYNYTAEYLSGLDTKLKENISNDDPADNYVSDMLYVGDYTLETIILYAENFYTIKTFLIKTEDYMQN